jgi:hypothetical protein
LFIIPVLFIFPVKGRIFSGGFPVSNFFSDLYDKKIKATLQTGKRVISSFSSLPDQYRTLEREFTALKEVVTELEVTLSSNDDEITLLNKLINESEEETALLKARSILLIALQKAITIKVSEANRDEIDGLMAKLIDHDKTIELLENLHDRLVTEAEDQKKELINSEKDKELILKELEKKDDSLARLDAEHDQLIKEVRESTAKTIEKLIDKGMSPTSISTLVPNIGNIYPREEIVKLEQEIRQHHEEQEALLGLEKLQSIRNPRDPETIAPVNDNRPIRTSSSPEIIEWKIETGSFFERIFSE